MKLKQHSKIYFALFSLLLFFVSSCLTHQKTQGFNKENGKYNNSEIGFEIDIPKDWYVFSDKQIENMWGEMWSKMIEEGLISKKEVDKNNAEYLFTGFKYRPSIDIEESPNASIILFPKEKIPNIQIVADNVENDSNIKTVSDYIAYEEIGQAPSELNPSQISKKIFSKKDFYYSHLFQQEDKNIATNKRYTTIIGKFALCITVSYFNEEEKKEIEKILETMKFEK